MQFTTTQPKVVFYEKTGCAGNAKQKKVLEYYNIPFETRSLLDTQWSVESLRAFFEGLEPSEMVNAFAPQIKRGEITLEAFNKDELIALMVQTPILIKRPLLVIGHEKICGFDVPKINKALGVNICEDLRINSCPSEEGELCTSA